MPPKAKAPRKAKGPPKRNLAEEFPPGEVLTDNIKKSWKLGTPIGQGGFGLIYLADENSAEVVGADAPYVIKVEPNENGPLFSELHFYLRAAKPDMIQSWMKARKMKYLGIPKYWASGQHERGGRKYRFMVMDRFGTDLQKKFEEGGKKFPRTLVLQLGLRLLDILEYMHEHEYVHADIKASNLLLSHTDPHQVYLVDYGLAYRYSPDGVLKKYKEDPKKCHDGTIEFTSIDAHKGVYPCRRSDLEILGYCMVQWLCGRLPWEDKLQDPVYVRDAKLRSREDIPGFMAQCFSSKDKPGEIEKFLEQVKLLDYTDKPPYDALRAILRAGLKATGAKDDGKLVFADPVANGAPAHVPPKATKRKKPSTEKEEGSKEEEDQGSPVKKRLTPKRKAKKAVARLVETSTQTSPGLALVKKPRARAKARAKKATG
ncbi:hypothetical protein CRUP_003886 [Coryphaenoides rupestris]|nr:hypothetical protein CRUP_003886 [Coryphaenoides rupestris]